MLEGSATVPRQGMLDIKMHLHHGKRAHLRILPPAGRFILRLDEAGLTRQPRLASMTIAQPINHWSGTAGQVAVRLGPDEWLLIVTESDPGAAAAEMHAALAPHHYALIDISHRNVGLEVSGAAAIDVLNSGCPLDLRNKAFPPGRGTRTQLGKAEIVLLRLHDVADEIRSPTPVFRIESWRSFGRYLHDFLQQAI